MSEANRVNIIYVPESVYGTTPSNSAAWETLRYTSSNLSAAPQTVISNEIDSSRQVSDLIKVSNQVQGEIGFELSCTTFDTLLQGLMYDTWSSQPSDTLRIDVDDTANQFTFEVQMLDWDTVSYLQYKGMRIAGASFNFAYGQVITGAFRLVGKSAELATTSLVGTGSVAPATSTDVLNGSDQVTSISLNGGAITGVTVKSITLNVDNSLRPIEGIGQAGPTNQAAGRCMVSGSIETYFDSSDLYDELLANTDISLDWTVSDGVNSYDFSLGKIKFGNGVPAVQGVDTDVMLPLDFTALKVATNTALEISR